ncbi:hypothetical protein THOM_1291 [Trachipleistophora hominis]|uniref:Uncharacterized protein n=1 Tax=Trachipleistophora hominis TaxID=72359 RepID=L7JWC0_TRAHO|nr:hypothetical protein THOM_1291 [Trachipleistophora hominis]
MIANFGRWKMKLKQSKKYYGIRNGKSNKKCRYVRHKFFGGMFRKRADGYQRERINSVSVVHL